MAYSKQERAKIARLHHSGLTDKEIGEKLGKTASTIAKFRSRNGISKNRIGIIEARVQEFRNHLKKKKLLSKMKEAEIEIVRKSEAKTGIRPDKIVKKCKVEVMEEYDNFYLVNFGNYKGTIDKNDLICEGVKVVNSC